MSHTPGPWHVGPKIDNWTHCSVCSWKDGIPDTSRTLIANVIDAEGAGDNAANANLIAAAPELLAACRDVYAKLCSRPDDSHVFDRDRAFLRDAIAKAAGSGVQDSAHRVPARRPELESLRIAAERVTDAFHKASPAAIPQELSHAILGLALTLGALEADTNA